MLPSMQAAPSSHIQSDHIPRYGHSPHRQGHLNQNRRPLNKLQNNQPKTKSQILCSNPAVYSKSRLVDRILSFQGWPNPHLASPKTFSEAGFYYLGSEDKVKCHNCGGGLGGWRSNEDPFYEHAKWFPECEYIQLYKGVEYVADVMQKNPGLKRPAIANPIPLPSYLFKNTTAADDRTNSPETSFRKRTLDEAMQNEVVTSALIMFDKSKVRHVVRKKLERDEEYTSMVALMEDVEKMDENDTEIMDSEPSTSSQSIHRAPSSLTSSPASSTESSPASSTESSHDIQADSFDFSSMTAGQVLMGNFSPLGIAPPSPATMSPPPSPVDFTQLEDDEETPDEEIHEDDRCKVCLDRRSDCVFMPCNHLCCCTSCASALKTCPVCRTKLKSIFKIYRR